MIFSKPWAPSAEQVDPSSIPNLRGGKGEGKVGENPFGLTGKVALVTGGAQGLGLSIAHALAEAGASVVLADINGPGAEKAARELMSLGRKALGLAADVTSAAEIAGMVQRTLEEFGQIDILVNNAGINRRIPALEMSEEDWRAVIDLNLTGVFLCCQAVGRHMVERRQGRIINMASMNARDRSLSAYCASKGGVVMLTKSLAAEWAPYGINVNAIAPGYFRTPLNEPWIRDPVVCQRSIDLTPQRRIAAPQEIGPTAVYLASAASSFVTGQVIVIDGGYTIW
jgi:NAD(P)-dependent dehydrogenase (short-subunit alcohol dehydrogenase family)